MPGGRLLSMGNRAGVTDPCRDGENNKPVNRTLGLLQNGPED